LIYFFFSKQTLNFYVFKANAEFLCFQIDWE